YQFPGRAAPPGRGGWAGRALRRAARQRAHQAVARPLQAAVAVLHPLRRVRRGVSGQDRHPEGVAGTAQRGQEKRGAGRAEPPRKAGVPGVRMGRGASPDLRARRADGGLHGAGGRWQVDPERAGSHERGPAEGVAQPARPAPLATQEFPRDVEAALMSRDNILHKVRTALGRSAGQAVADVPPVRLRVPQVAMEDRIALLRSRLDALAGKTARVPTMNAAREFVAAAIAGKTAVASNAPYLEECGIARLPGVRSGIREVGELTEVCARVDIGITSADFALSDTGTLVMIASPAESRLVSLLPPAHLAVVPVERILTGLDELFTLLPDPAAQTSSMVLITGPSRTADIEQILVRGVHGPGQVTVVIVG